MTGRGNIIAICEEDRPFSEAAAERLRAEAPGLTMVFAHDHIILGGATGEHAAAAWRIALLNERLFHTARAYRAETLAALVA